MNITRRNFISSYAALHFAAVPSFLTAAPRTNKRILAVLLRGGLDGLFVMPPKFDPSLQNLRPKLLEQNYLDLTSDFSLLSELSFVSRLYQENSALFVHASSFPYTGRSHFDGQNIMETGDLTPYATKSGWLGRLIDEQGQHQTMKSLSLSLPTPLIMRGNEATVNHYPTWMTPVSSTDLENVSSLFANEPELKSTMRLITERDPQISARMTRRNTGGVGLSDLAREAAYRFNKDDGPRVAVLDHLGFDTHANAPFDTVRLLKELDVSLQDFREKLADEVWKETYIITITEFGRTAAENNALGTEHGYGSLTMVLGGALKKSGVLTDWPGLRKKDLFEQRDLNSTIDARSVYGAVMRSYLDTDHNFIKQRILDYPVNSLLDNYI